jgi:hypothetical protein
MGTADAIATRWGTAAERNGAGGDRRASIEFEPAAASGAQVVRRLGAILGIVALAAAIAHALAWFAGDTLRDARRLNAELRHPRLAFGEFDPAFDRPFAEALAKNFYPARDHALGLFSSPALELIETRRIAGDKLEGRYRNLWWYLEHQLVLKNHDRELAALRAYLGAADREKLPSATLRADDRFADWEYRARARLALLWYLEHHYLGHVDAYYEGAQPGRAAAVARAAGERLRLARQSVTAHPDRDTRTRMNTIRLAEALFDEPALVYGRPDEVRLLLRIARDDFHADGRALLVASGFSPGLEPYKQYWLGVYEFRERRYTEARRRFGAIASTARPRMLRELSHLLVVRSMFWELWQQAIAEERELAPGAVAGFQAEARAIADKVGDREIRADILEYLQLAAEQASFRPEAAAAPPGERGWLANADVAGAGRGR